MQKQQTKFSPGQIVITANAQQTLSNQDVQTALARHLQGDWGDCELRPFLDECWELAEPGTEFVITRYRSQKQNLRTHLMRIVKRAGLEPWAKLWHNLRATRQTELMEEFPSHVVCKWIGNSIKIAEKHYLQVTDDHFSKATQNPTQSLLGSACQLMSPKKQTPQMPVSGTSGHGLTLQTVGDEGFEPPTSTV